MTSVDDSNRFEPDPEDWLALDPDTLSPEAVANDPDDVATALPDDAPLPGEADEADVIDQRTEAGLTDDEDEDEPDGL